MKKSVALKIIHNIYDDVENVQVEIKHLRKQAEKEIELAQAKINAYNKSIAKLDSVLKKYVDYSPPIKSVKR